MSSGTDALYGFAAHDPRRHTPQAIAATPRALPQSILAHLALAFVATTCLWTVYSHLGDGGAEVATLAERFAALPVQATAPAPAPTAPEATTVQKRYSGLLDGRHLGVTPGTLSRGKPSTLADHLATLVTPSAPKSQDRLAPSPSETLETAQGVPLPAARPSRLAALQQGPDTPAPAPFTPKVVVEDKATVLALISSRKNSLFDKLFGKPKAQGTTLAYASPDGGIASDTKTILFDGMPKYDQWTAVYDISARKVYLPDGTELEAHSGLGKRMDDPRHVHVKMHGATPPHVYNLTMRESLFHGVEALRLNPVGGDGRIFGRKGLLTHTYLLGPRGDSNGCISFRNYNAFLQAYKKGLIKRMVVVAKLA
jgi:hypothetical protein